MNILYHTVLLVMIIGYVIVSSEFRKAVDREDLNTALQLYEQNNTHQYCKAKYLLKKASTEFIVKFARQTHVPDGIVAALYTSGSNEKREEVFGKVCFDDNSLALAAENSELSCQLGNLLDLLERITPEQRESAIGHSILGLFEGKRTDCIDPLLKALKNEKDSEYQVVRAIFLVGAFHDESWLRRFYDHPAITPDLYAGVLIDLVDEKGIEDPIFEFLLGEADQGDLEAFLDNKDYKKLEPDLRDAIFQVIKQASFIAQPGGSRPSTREKAKMGKETFDEATTGKTSNIKGPSNLIEEYANKEEE